MTMLIRQIAISLILFIIISVQSTLAQTPTPLPQQSQFIETIQQLAQRHVERGISPPDIADLNILFGEEAEQLGLSPREVLTIYESAYVEAKSETPWWQPVLPNVGWGVAIILFLLLILRDFIQNYLRKVFAAISEVIYQRLSGTKLLRWQAYRRYRRALIANYGTLKIPIWSYRTLPTDKFYVPLSVVDTNGKVIEALEMIKDNKRLIVVGVPGSGKSMLLRWLALTYAQGNLEPTPQQSIPILLELSRLNQSNDPLKNHLVQVLKRNDFPSADDFVHVGLEQGLLMLLFDGLDEVNTDKREHVVRQIKDLLNQHDDCRAIITCRTQAYHHEFAGWADQKLELAEFNDQQIQQFLTFWAPDMPPGKSVDHMMYNLRDRPRIMTLARNPLLLTIIVYLYTDTEFILPHSRPEFYSIAVNQLLDQWKSERNRYKLAHKRLVLQHLALFNQDSADLQSLDRRSIDLPTILAQIKKVIPSLALHDDDALPILREIVERSGLLLVTDGGATFQFADLSLQEFFAAEALMYDEQALLSRFQKNPDLWLEILKLWCGLAHDSTHLVQAVYVQNPTLGFECLAEVQQINPDLADEMLVAMQKYLRTAPVIDNTIIRAFAAVAADPRPRGHSVFKNLSQMLADDSFDSKRRFHIASILARTNLPQAAVILAQNATDLPELRTQLVQMGDLAVEPLVSLTEDGAMDVTQAMGVLEKISTSKAIEAVTRLIPLLRQKIAALQTPQLLEISFDRGISGIYVNQKSMIRLKVSSLFNEPIEDLTFELEDTPKYEVISLERKIHIAKLSAGEHLLLEYQILASNAGEFSLQLKVNGRVYKQTGLDISAVQASPYSYGSPVQDVHFVGRTVEVETSYVNVTGTGDSPPKPTMIIGEQRSGKTSLLFKIERKLERGFPFIPVYISFLESTEKQRQSEELATSWFLNSITHRIRKVHNLSVAQFPSFHSSEYSFVQYLEKVIEVMKGVNEDYKIVLLLDECNIMNQIGLSFQESLRQALVRLSDDIRAILACYHDFIEVRPSNSVASPLPNICQHIPLKPLEGDELEQLIVIPAQRFDYQYEDNAKNMIKESSGGHPYYCQFLCAVSLQEGQRANARKITHRHVQQAEKKVIEADKVKFEMGYWSRMTLPEQQLLRSLVTSSQTTALLLKEITSLEEKFVIKETSKGYEFTATLFKTWVEQLSKTSI